MVLQSSLAKLLSTFNTKSVKKSDSLARQKDENSPPQVKVVFDGDLQKKFEAVKSHYGVRNNSDLIRLLITSKYDELKKTGEI